MTWEFNEADDGKGAWGEQIDPPTPPAVYWEDVTICWLNVDEWPQEEANKFGRLLAAAPDLLAACKASRAFGSQGDTHEGLSVSEIIRAAIAKAEAS